MSLNSEANIKCIAQKMSEVITKLDSIIAGGAQLSSTASDDLITLTGGDDAGIAANADRRYLFIQNKGSNIAYFSYLGAASANSIAIPAGGTYENPSHFCPPGAIRVFGTAADKILIIEA